MTEDDRIKVTGAQADSCHAGYPFSRRADLSDIWIVVAECGMGHHAAVDREPVAWGTVGEYIDHAIETSEIGADEVEEMIAAMKGEGSYLLGGFVGGGFRITRVEDPEAALAYGATAPTP